MEPLLIILIPGVLGGLVVAALIARTRLGVRTGGRGGQLAPPSPYLINMAHIRVEGGGGLGMVAAVIAVALADPRIRVAIAIAAVLGAALAFVLIAHRRRHGGPLEGGGAPGAHSMLRLDLDDRAPEPSANRERSAGGLPGSPRHPGLRLAAGH